MRSSPAPQFLPRAGQAKRPSLHLDVRRRLRTVKVVAFPLASAQARATAPLSLQESTTASVVGLATTLHTFVRTTVPILSIYGLTIGVLPVAPLAIFPRVGPTTTAVIASPVTLARQGDTPLSEAPILPAIQDNTPLGAVKTGLHTATPLSKVFPNAIRVAVTVRVTAFGTSLT